MSKPIDQRNRGNTSGVSRRPAAPVTPPRPPASSGKGQAGNGTPRATSPKAGTRPATRSAITTTSRKPQARKGGISGWKPLDLAIIVGFMLVVGVVIWFGLGNVSSPPVASNVAGSTGSGQTNPSTGSGEPALAVNIGQAAPDFSLPGTDGQTYSLSQFKGKVVMVEFMAPWCPHCQEDAPIFNQVHEAYKDKNLQMLALNATGFGRNYESGDETPITMADQVWFHDNFQVAYPLLFDKDVVIAQQYGISHFPTVFVLDTTGTVVATPANPITFDGLSAALDQVLKGSAAAESDGR